MAQAVSVQSVLSEMASAHHDLVVFDKQADSWHRYPWAQVHELACVIAHQLVDRAGGPPTVGLVGEPTYEFIAALPAAWLAGGCFTIAPGPVRGADPARWTRATLERFESVGVTSIYSHGPALELLRSGGARVAVDDLDTVTTLPRTGAGSAPDDPERTAILQSTAGSTGSPQTVAIPGRAILANIGGLAGRFQIGADDVGCSWLPLYHDMGLTFLLACMARDVELWQAPTSAFSAAPFRWLDWISAGAATMTAAPNFAYNLIGRYSSRVRDVELSTVRMALNGGEAVDCAGFERFASAMMPFGFDPHAATPAYGLAESTCAVTAPAPGTGLRHDDAGSRHAVLGTPIAGTEVRIRPHDSGACGVPDREVGEVEIRGRSMMTGYLGSAHHDRDTWFGTGDLGYLTDDGLVVCGRIKEVIHLAGRNLFPTDIERVAASVDGIREGAVVATDLPSAGRAGLAIVAEYRGNRQSGARQQVVERVAAECGVVAATVELVDPGYLPRTTSGKLRRIEVGRRLGSGAFRNSPPN